MVKWIMLMVAAACVVAAGCQHCTRPAPPPPPPCYPGAAPVPFPGGVPVVPGGAPVMPPPGAIIKPPPGSVMQPPMPAPGAGPVLPPQQSNLGPAPPDYADSSWQAPKKQIQLNPPEPMTQNPPPGGGDLPETPPGQGNTDPLLNTPPGKAAQPAPESPLPSGIAQFAVALPDGVTSGLRPMLDGGLDWLKKNGYKTVLHIKRPGQDDSADRKQVENRGMAYLSLEMSPETLNSKVIADFTKIVQDKSNYPLFVYDKDGALAGGLWYLYFRQTEDEQVARVRAHTLGLRFEDKEGPSYEMWLAIQSYLAGKS